MNRDTVITYLLLLFVIFSSFDYNCLYRHINAQIWIFHRWILHLFSCRTGRRFLSVLHGFLRYIYSRTHTLTHKSFFIDSDTKYYQEKGASSALSHLDTHLRDTQPAFPVCVKGIKNPKQTNYMVPNRKILSSWNNSWDPLLLPLTPNTTTNMDQSLFPSLNVMSLTLNCHTVLTNGEAGRYIAEALKSPAYSNYLFVRREQESLPAESKAINSWGIDALSESKPCSHGWADNLPNVSLHSPLDLQTGKHKTSAPPHNFSEKQQRAVNKPGNGRRIALIWGYQPCSIKLHSAGTVMGKGQMIWGIIPDCLFCQGGRVFGKQNIRPCMVEEIEEGENNKIFHLSQEPWWGQLSQLCKSIRNLQVWRESTNENLTEIPAPILFLKMETNHSDSVFLSKLFHQIIFSKPQNSTNASGGNLPKVSYIYYLFRR